MGPAGSSLRLPSLPPGVPPDHPDEQSALLPGPHHPALRKPCLLWPRSPWSLRPAPPGQGHRWGCLAVPRRVAWTPEDKGESEALWVLVQWLWPRAAQRQPCRNFYEVSPFWEGRWALVLPSPSLPRGLRGRVLPVTGGRGDRRPGPCPVPSLTNFSTLPFPAKPSLSPSLLAPCEQHPAPVTGCTPHARTRRHRRHTRTSCCSLTQFYGVVPVRNGRERRRVQRDGGS